MMYVADIKSTFPKNTCKKNRDSLLMKLNYETILQKLSDTNRITLPYFDHQSNTLRLLDRCASAVLYWNERILIGLSFLRLKNFFSPAEETGPNWPKHSEPTNHNHLRQELCSSSFSAILKYQLLFVI